MEEEQKGESSGFEFHEINYPNYETKKIETNYFVATTDTGFILYKKNEENHKPEVVKICDKINVGLYLCQPYF